jgi:hypothetical protein
MRRAYRAPQTKNMQRLFTVIALVFAFAGCGGSGSSSTMPAAQPAKVRYLDGAPSLETLLGTNLYLQDDSRTVVSIFDYGSMSSFLPVAAGTHELVARNTLGYSVGPLKTTALSPGKRYTLIVVGSNTHYRVLTFEEPTASADAAVSLYGASPSTPKAFFGTFKASTGTGFKQLGSARFGTLATVSLGKSVPDVGGYVGQSSRPLGDLTPSQINSFDLDNILPFQRQSRLSLFLFDPKSGTPRVFGSLDE